MLLDYIPELDSFRRTGTNKAESLPDGLVILHPVLAPPVSENDLRGHLGLYYNEYDLVVEVGSQYRFWFLGCSNKAE